MKTLKNYLIIALMLLMAFASNRCMGQIIEPAIGDRVDYFLIDNAWYNNLWKTTPIALKTFNDGEHYSMWVLNLNLSESDFVKLANYLDHFEELNIMMDSRASDDGGKTWYIDSFEIHGKDVYEMPVGKETRPDIFFVTKKIKYFLNGQ